MIELIIKRELLYKAIWKEPINVLCEKYYISENKLKDICKYLNVPIPSKVYWKQLDDGKSPKIKELPRYDGKDEWVEEINEYDVERKKELKKDSLIGYDENERNDIKKAISEINLNEIKQHPLVKLRKSTINVPQERLDIFKINESKGIKKRIDLIYNVIFNVIERLQYKIEEKDGKYIAIIKGEEIPFKIREKAKIKYSDANENTNDLVNNVVYVNGERKIREIIPSGILELKIDYYGKKDTWNDTTKTKLENVIGDIIVEIFYCAALEKERRIEREKECEESRKRESEKFNKVMLLRPKELGKLFEIGKKISKIELGIHGSKIRSYILEDIIEKTVLHLGTFIKIIQNSNINELDISILATIARNIMECSNAYFYYAERKITDEEVEFRYHIANLHYDNNMIDITKKLNYSQDCFRVRSLYLGKELSKKAIQNSKLYDELSKIEKSQVLNGTKAYISKRQKSLHTILDKDTESAIYNIFSNSTHAYYIGLGSNSMNGSIAHISYIKPEMLLSLSMEICIIYAAHIMDDYLQLIKILNQYITNEERKFIKNTTSIDKFLKWLDIQREDYKSTFMDDLSLPETKKIIFK